MQKLTRSTWLSREEDAAVASICNEKQWSVSKTIRALILESPTFRKALTKRGGNAAANRR